jgi:kinesin family protein 6/9
MIPVANRLCSHTYLFQTVNIHCKRDARKGVVNNQILDWSFKMDGILHNASQDGVYDTCAQDVVSAALDGYNGTQCLHLT